MPIEKERLEQDENENPRSLLEELYSYMKNAKVDGITFVKEGDSFLPMMDVDDRFYDQDRITSDPLKNGGIILCIDYFLNKKFSRMFFRESVKTVIGENRKENREDQSLKIEIAVENVDLENENEIHESLSQQTKRIAKKNFWKKILIDLIAGYAGGVAFVPSPGGPIFTVPPLIKKDCKTRLDLREMRKILAQGFSMKDKNEVDLKILDSILFRAVLLDIEKESSIGDWAQESILKIQQVLDIDNIKEWIQEKLGEMKTEFGDSDDLLSDVSIAIAAKIQNWFEDKIYKLERFVDIKSWFNEKLDKIGEIKDFIGKSLTKMMKVIGSTENALDGENFYGSFLNDLRVSLKNSDIVERAGRKGFYLKDNVDKENSFSVFSPTGEDLGRVVLSESSNWEKDLILAIQSFRGFINGEDGLNKWCHHPLA